jgi:uncharacterized protein YajQ (UPF0234 family)
MKIPAIKKLIERYPMVELLNAEIQLLEGEPAGIEVEGEDEGEQLTHIIAAIWIMEEMKNKSIDFQESLRAYTKKVRESIN